MSVQSLALRHGKLEEPIAFFAANAQPAEEFLSQSEAQHVARLQFAAKKEGFLLGRLAAKRALGALLAEPDLRRIGIQSGVYGQPLVRHPRAGGLEVTVSHSHGLAVALAFPAGYPMGIDIETGSTVSAPTILGEVEASPPELAWLVSSGVDEATACCVLWTAREALGKALKLGLNSPLGVLALAEIRSDGPGAWLGRYQNFPRCKCLVRVAGGRTLALALPGDAELSEALRLPPD